MEAPVIPPEDGSVPRPDWQQAELTAMRHLRSVGYADATLTAPGADAGADVRAKGCVAQVKAWAGAVGRPELQALHGAATVERAQAVFYSAGGYSRQAREFAGAAGIALFVLELIASPLNHSEIKAELCQLAERLSDCSDTLPAWLCSDLGLPVGSSFAEGCVVVKARWCSQDQG